MKITKKPTQKQIAASRAVVPVSALFPGKTHMQPTTSKITLPARTKNRTTSNP